MKIKKILCFLLVILLALAMAPSFACTEASAEETEEKFSLVPYNFNIAPSEYGISPSLVSTYTPFDFSTEARRPGMSFYFAQAEDGQIDGARVQTKRVSGLETSQNYSLYAWLCFDQYDLHDVFDIRLIFSSGASLAWQKDKASLVELMEKNGVGDALFTPHNWALFEFPFAGGVPTSTTTSGGQWLDIVGVQVSYLSEETIDDRDYAFVRFYDLYVAKSTPVSSTTLNTEKEVKVKEKQDYRICAINSFSQDQVGSMIIGDSLTFPTLKNAVRYAYEGETDLLAQEYVGEWRVLVQTPSGDENQTCKFGSSYTFESEGTYTIHYQCLHGGTQASISMSQPITINRINPIYFNKNNFSIEVGKAYRVKLFTSSLFASVSDFEFVSGDQNLEYNYLGNGQLDVKGLKAGDYTLTVRVSGTRPNGQTEDYETTLSFTAVNKPVDDNLGVKIFIYVILAIFVIVLIVLAIKSLVKSRKFDVK